MRRMMIARTARTARGSKRGYETLTNATRAIARRQFGGFFPLFASLLGGRGRSKQDETMTAKLGIGGASRPKVLPV